MEVLWFYLNEAYAKYKFYLFIKSHTPTCNSSKRPNKTF